MAIVRNEREMIEGWLRECADSDVGLWWLADDIREALPAETPEDAVRHETMRMISRLLETRVVRAVTLETDGGYTAWQGTVDEQLSRIDSEWEALGKPPGIGDIVWFIGPREPR
jgi:hypothetical protein